MLQTFFSFLALFQTNLPGRLPSHLTFFFLQFWHAMATFTLLPVLRGAAAFEPDAGMSDDVAFITYLLGDPADLLSKRGSPRRNKVLVSQSLASATPASRCGS